MNWAKMAMGVVAIGALVGVTSEVLASPTCLTFPRPLPLSGAQDTITMSCQSLGGVTTSGVSSILNAAGNFSVNTNLTAGLENFSQGLDSAGTVVCSSTDTTVGGGNNVVNCPATIATWRGGVWYNP